MCLHICENGHNEYANEIYIYLYRIVSYSLILIL